MALTIRQLDELVAATQELRAEVLDSIKPRAREPLAGLGAVDVPGKLAAIRDQVEALIATRFAAPGGSTSRR